MPCSCATQGQGQKRRRKGRDMSRSDRGSDHTSGTILKLELTNSVEFPKQTHSQAEEASIAKSLGGAVRSGRIGSLGSAGSLSGTKSLRRRAQSKTFTLTDLRTDDNLSVSAGSELLRTARWGSTSLSVHLRSLHLFPIHRFPLTRHTSCPLRKVHLGESPTHRHRVHDC